VSTYHSKARQLIDKVQAGLQMVNPAESVAPLSHLQHLGSHSIVFDVRRDVGAKFDRMPNGVSNQSTKFNPKSDTSTQPN